MRGLSLEFLAAFAVVYVVVLELGLTAACALTGWARARAAHPCDGDCPAPGVFAGVYYGNWMTYALTTRVSSDKWALHLSGFPVIFAPTHAPIALQWKDIKSIRRKKLWFGWVYELEVEDLPGLRLALGRRAWHWVARHAEEAGLSPDHGGSHQHARNG